MTLDDTLQQLFAANFVAYYRSHVAHVNVQGRTFYSDHKLLGRIYEDLQADVDHIAEFLRTRQMMMPTTLTAVIMASMIADQPTEGSSDQLLDQVRAALLELIEILRELDDRAMQEQQIQFSDYAQARIRDLDKWVWQLDSTLI